MGEQMQGKADPGDEIGQAMQAEDEQARELAMQARKKTVTMTVMNVSAGLDCLHQHQEHLLSQGYISLALDFLVDGKHSFPFGDLAEVDLLFSKTVVPFSGQEQIEYLWALPPEEVLDAALIHLDNSHRAGKLNYIEMNRAVFILCTARDLCRIVDPVSTFWTPQQPSPEAR